MVLPAETGLPLVFHSLHGSSPAVSRLRAQIRQSVFTHDLRRFRRVLYRTLGDFTHPDHRALGHRQLQPTRVAPPLASDPVAALGSEVADLALDVESLVRRYATLAYSRTGSYVEAARRLGIDRRTVKARMETSSWPGCGPLADGPGRPTNEPARRAGAQLAQVKGPGRQQASAEAAPSPATDPVKVERSLRSRSAPQRGQLSPRAPSPMRWRTSKRCSQSEQAYS